MGSNVDQLIQETQPLALSRSFHFLFQIMSQVNNFKAAAATTVAVLRLDWSLFLLIWADNNQKLNPGRAGKGGGGEGKGDYESPKPSSLLCIENKNLLISSRNSCQG